MLEDGMRSDALLLYAFGHLQHLLACNARRRRLEHFGRNLQ
jgi:hypothetical protein